MSGATGIGGFSVVGRLGRGAMGEVLLARQSGLDRLCALKVLPPDLAFDDEFVKRFLREAKAAALLSHPNVVAVYDAGHDAAARCHFIAFELVEGSSLEDRLQHGPLGEVETLRLALGVLGGLAFAHGKGLVHRDLKPDNILFASDGTPKISDLGIAKRTDEASITQTGFVLGTPCYMAPEQALGQKDLDGRADLYSLGLVLWRCLTGAVPFDEDPPSAALELLSRHVHEDLPDVRERAPAVSAGTARLVAGLAARDRGARYHGAAQAVRDLERLLAGEPLSGPRAPSDEAADDRAARASALAPRVLPTARSTLLRPRTAATAGPPRAASALVLVAAASLGVGMAAGAAPAAQPAANPAREATVGPPRAPMADDFVGPITPVPVVAQAPAPLAAQAAPAAQPATSAPPLEASRRLGRQVDDLSSALDHDVDEARALWLRLREQAPPTPEDAEALEVLGRVFDPLVDALAPAASPRRRAELVEAAVQAASRRTTFAGGRSPVRPPVDAALRRWAPALAQAGAIFELSRARDPRARIAALRRTPSRDDAHTVASDLFFGASALDSWVEAPARGVRDQRWKRSGADPPPLTPFFQRLLRPVLDELARVVTLAGEQVGGPEGLARAALAAGLDRTSPLLAARVVDVDVPLARSGVELPAARGLLVVLARPLLEGETLRVRTPAGEVVLRADRVSSVRPGGAGKELVGRLAWAAAPALLVSAEPEHALLVSLDASTGALHQGAGASRLEVHLPGLSSRARLALQADTTTARVAVVSPSEPR